MVPLSSLWLPILLSAVVVFAVSSLIHMVLGYHANDYAKVPDEDQVADALRPFAIPPGDYSLPRPTSMKEMGSPGFLEKLNRGPVLMMSVLPNGPFSIGRSMVQWFVYCAVVGLVAAYVAGRALPSGAEYLDVFRFAGTAAFAAYALGAPPASIWSNRKWSTTLKSMFDGLVYAVLTAGVFGWLWPS